MTLMDYGYLLTLIGVGFACLVILFIEGQYAKRKKHAQKLGESEKGKK